MIDGFLMGPSPLIQTVAREYDSTATYRVGDYCTRDGKIYKCTTAISTAENFDTSHWEFVVICDEFASQLGIVEKTNTATHNITSGQYVIWKGLLYTASSTITSGDTLSDSNLTRVENGGLNSLSSNSAKWKTHVTKNTINGTSTRIQLPSNYTELLVYVYDNDNCFGVIHIIKDILSSSTATFRPAGFYENSANYGDVVLFVSLTEVWGFVRFNGSVASTTATVFYKE